MRIALAGAGAFGRKHLNALRAIPDVEVVSLVGRTRAATEAVAVRYGIGHVSTDLAQTLALPGVEAVILCTPTPLHARQALQCLDAGKHVQVEIPLADSLADAEAVLARQRSAGLVCMVGHTRRFNPGHRWLHCRIGAGEVRVQQMDVQTYFLRRQNINADGELRSWTDHLLWHHAAHTIDLFHWQAGPIVAAHAMQGPVHPVLGIATDLSIQLRSAAGALCTLSLSFNNDGPIGTSFRYICDTGTWIAQYDDLMTGAGEPVDLSDGSPTANGIELQDRAFIDAIRDRHEPEASVARVMPCYRILDRLERQLAGNPSPRCRGAQRSHGTSGAERKAESRGRIVQ